MEGLEKFRKLKVWQKAHILVKDIYKLTENYPKDEKYGLISQMKRASVSVAVNIVEGTKRKTSKDRQHFYTMSNTSLEEIKYYIILGYELGYHDEENGKKLMEQSREIGRMLTGLINCQ